MPPSVDRASAALFERILLRAPIHDQTVVDDLNFLAAWQQQPLPSLGSALRIRQLRRANPEDGKPVNEPGMHPSID